MPSASVDKVGGVNRNGDREAETERKGVPGSILSTDGDRRAGWRELAKPFTRCGYTTNPATWQSRGSDAENLLRDSTWWRILGCLRNAALLSPQCLAAKCLTTLYSCLIHDPRREANLLESLIPRSHPR